MTLWEKHGKRITELKDAGLGSIKISRELAKDGIIINDRLIRKMITNHYAKNKFTEKLDENNFEYPDNFEYGWLKTKEASIFVKNTKNILSFDEIQSDFKAKLEKYSPSHIKYNRKPLKDPHLLVIDIADLHIGKLSDSLEVGKDFYNSDLAVQRALEGVRGILDKASGFQIEKILFVIGNDVLHVDNANKSTTSGTGQDVDRMWYRNYLLARDMYIEVINMLLSVADVHIVYNPSNHDYISGFMLSDSIYCWFRKHKNITFDVSIAHRKYYQYGKNLIGTSHGDGAKMDSLPLIMSVEAKEYWADVEFRYIYLHHIHHKDVTKFKIGKDFHGVTVEYLRSPSGTDSWHHRNGYQHSPKAIEGFLHHKDFGQVARLTHLFI